ncbi:GNAT family N-acetyltransferase [Tsukamurella strandjordii]|uniref:GNAT family N-acetyltransferase n=1 Tax=Tsukamurella strandjordii TaxID=147577 RepID=UPI0031E286D1
MRSTLGSRLPSVADGAAGDEYLVRPARLLDYRSWRATRMANERRLAPAFGSPDRLWSALNTRSAWLERFGPVPGLSRRGRSLTYVVVARDPRGHERIVGEVGIRGVDPVTASGEISVWATDLPDAVMPWATASLVAAAFASEHRLDRVVAPVARNNPGPCRMFEAVGMERRAVRRSLREYDGAPRDHDIWVIENTPATRAALRDLAADSAPGARSGD